MKPSSSGEEPPRRVRSIMIDVRLTETELRALQHKFGWLGATKLERSIPTGGDTAAEPEAREGDK